MQNIKTGSSSALRLLTNPSPTNQPPTPADFWRIDLAVLGVVLFALFLGLGVRNQTQSASNWVTLGRDLPRIAYPATWMQRTSDEYLLRALDAGSPSTFDPQVAVSARTQRQDETLELARTDRTFQMASSQAGYREFDAQQVLVYRNTPALATSYAFIADPTRASGASGLPVVVEAQDIMFFDSGQFIVVTVASDTNLWEAAQRDFQIILDSMRVRPQPEAPAPVATAAPADEGATATPAASSDESFSGASQQGAAGTEGGN